MFAIGAVFFFFGNANAQQARQADTEFVAPKKLKRTLPKKVEEESPIKLNGSLTKAFKSKQPWQMVSPLAPASYGNSEENVSKDPDEIGRNEGLLLFGIQW
ncbi:MAG: hypothetical protein K2W97_01900 [Chthoniobacterales bacterium]|nr:hypothetical protein [Chthoniobacterales bacterium]